MYSYRGIVMPNGASRLPDIREYNRIYKYDFYAASSKKYRRATSVLWNTVVFTYSHPINVD